MTKYNIGDRVRVVDDTDCIETPLAEYGVHVGDVGIVNKILSSCADYPICVTFDHASDKDIWCADNEIEKENNYEVNLL